MSPRRQPETIAIIKDARPGRNKERFGITAVTSRSGKHFYRSLAAHTIVIEDIDRVKRPFRRASRMFNGKVLITYAHSPMIDLSRYIYG